MIDKELALELIRDITSSAYYALALQLLRKINSISANAIKKNNAKKT